MEAAKGKINTEYNTIEKICKFIEELNTFQFIMQKLEENAAKMGSIYSLIKKFNIDTVLAKD